MSIVSVVVPAYVNEAIGKTIRSMYLACRKLSYKIGRGITFVPRRIGALAKKWKS